MDEGVDLAILTHIAVLSGMNVGCLVRVLLSVLTVRACTKRTEILDAFSVLIPSSRLGNMSVLLPCSRSSACFFACCF